MKSYVPAIGFAALAISCLGCFFVPKGYNPYGGGTSGGGSSMQSGSSGASNAGSSNAGSSNAGSSNAGQSNQPQPAPEFIPSSLEMHSDCGKTLPLFLGEKPKFGSGTKTSIGSNTTTTFPRHPDGTMTVWIIDDSENGITSAFADKKTRRIEVGGDCKSLRAQ
ncbi:MAG: hypothetical protein U0441_11435 [Polyangiaceae bacterium]